MDFESFLSFFYLWIFAIFGNGSGNFVLLLILHDLDFKSYLTGYKKNNLINYCNKSFYLQVQNNSIQIFSNKTEVTTIRGPFIQQVFSSLCQICFFPFFQKSWSSILISLWSTRHSLYKEGNDFICYHGQYKQQLLSVVGNFSYRKELTAVLDR